MPEIEYVNKITFSQQNNLPFGQVDIELETLGGAYNVGDDIAVTIAGEDVDCSVTRIIKELSINGWRQKIHALTQLGKIAEKAPKKKQIFMTLSITEYNDFLKDFYPYTKRRIEHLDYNPHIKLGDEYGNGGWTSHEIVEILASMMGISIGANTTLNYPVRQFSVEPQQPFMDAIISLINIFESLLHYEGGKLFIIDSSSTEEDWGVGWTPTNIRLVTEEINKNDKPAQIKVSGNLGEFRPEKYKGYAGNTNQTSFGVWLGNAFVPVTISGSYHVKTTKSSYADTQTTVEKYVVTDIFGNDSWVVYEQYTVEQLGWLGTPMWPPVILSKRQILRSMADTHYAFSHPRELGTLEVIGKRINYPFGGSVINEFVSEVEKIEKSYAYNSDGTLESENTKATSLCYSDDNGSTWSPIKNLGTEDVLDSGITNYLVTWEESIDYSQVSRESYMAKRLRVSLDESGKQVIREDAQIVQAGAVQGNKSDLRKMHVYAETGEAVTGNIPDSTETMNSPAVEVSVNTPSWEAIEDILTIIQNRLLRNEVLRVYEIAGELNVHLGLGVNMAGISNVDGSETINAPALYPGSLPIVTGYTIEKDMLARVAKTRLEVRGRLAA
ncbi:MAG: hypothetical protein HYW14_04130 [Planctomycetes bacterium]|nr:hypothetical protein [Planctomycetota bacterium]